MSGADRSLDLTMSQIALAENALRASRVTTSRMCCGPEGLPEGHWSWVSCCVAVNTVTSVTCTCSRHSRHGQLSFGAWLTWLHMHGVWAALCGQDSGRIRVL